MTTIRDIAKECGVSITAVSHTINGKGRISEETRGKVLAAIKRLQYDPAGHLPASKLAATHTIGLVLPLPVTGPTDSFYSRAILAASAAASERGYACKVFTEPDIRAATTVTYHRGRSQLGCDQLIMYCPRKNWQDTLRILRSWDLPAAVIRRSTDIPGTLTFVNDDYAGAGLAMDHLLAQGHRVIAGCVHHLDSPVEHTRLQCYRDRVRKHGLPDAPHLTVNLENDYARFKQRLTAMFESAPAPTAVFCTGDTLATRLIRKIICTGQRVPQDVSVIGYDDDPIAAEYNPPLTTVRIPVEDMVRAAVDALVDREVPGNGVREMTFDNELIVRESTGNARDADGDRRYA